MAVTRAHTYEEVSDALFGVLPAGPSLVGHYRSCAEWGEAILESLAIFAVQKAALPADVRAMVIEFADQDGLFWKVRKRVHYLLGRIPE